MTVSYYVVIASVVVCSSLKVNAIPLTMLIFSYLINYSIQMRKMFILLFFLRPTTINTETISDIIEKCIGHPQFILVIKGRCLIFYLINKFYKELS